MVWASGKHEWFGDDFGGILLLVTDDDKSCSWAAFHDGPAGRRVECGEAERAAYRYQMQEN